MSFRSKSDADAIARAYEERRVKAPRASALEDRAYELLYGATTPKMTDREQMELEGVAMALAGCGVGLVGDVDQSTADYWSARLAEFEARRSLVVGAGDLAGHRS